MRVYVSGDTEEMAAVVQVFNSKHIFQCEDIRYPDVLSLIGYTPWSLTAVETIALAVFGPVSIPGGWRNNLALVLTMRVLRGL